MSLFSKVSPPPPRPAPAPPLPPDVSKVEVGARVGNLVCLGSFWLDFSAVTFINTRPFDGCGAEIELGAVKRVHLNAHGAACLQKYLDQELAKSSEVKELERMIG